MKNRLILKDPNTGVITRTKFDLTSPDHTFLGNYQTEEIIGIQTFSGKLDNKGIEICNGDHLYVGAKDALVKCGTVKICEGEFVVVISDSITPLRLLGCHTLIVVGNIWGVK